MVPGSNNFELDFQKGLKFRQSQNIVFTALRSRGKENRPKKEVYIEVLESITAVKCILLIKKKLGRIGRPPPIQLGLNSVFKTV